MMAPTAWRPRANHVFAIAGALSMLGMTVLVVMLLFGFEEPNTTLLTLASILIFIAPLVMLLHLALTKDLGGGEKRIWMRELTSARAPGALAAYFTADDRREACRQFEQAALDRDAARRSQSGLPRRDRTDGPRR
jgi:hypothetical protein